MAVTVAGISAGGLQVERMMTTAYLEGRMKVNGTGGLLTDRAFGGTGLFRLYFTP